MRYQPFGFLLLFGSSVLAYGADDVAIKVESLSNTSGNGAIEACGTAVHKTGAKPLAITLKHGQSFYTTLTGPNDKWCVLFKRWTFSGKIEVSASILGQSQLGESFEVELP